MRIREATRADLPALTALELRTMGGDAWSAQQVGEELDRPGASCLVAEDEGIIGLAFGWTVFEELQVMQIAVHPDRRQQGVGQALLRGLEGARPSAEVAFLEVRVDNDPAIRLYVGAGYRIISRRPRYYADGCDALVMRKNLERR